MRAVCQRVSRARVTVDGVAVGEIAPVNGQLAALVPYVVQRPARGRPNEHVNVGAKQDERLGHVRAHEAVGARDERGPPLVRVGEIAAQRFDGTTGPERGGVRRHVS
jgi:hypothetical protein